MKYLAPLLLLLASCGTTRVMAVGGKSDFGSDAQPIEEHVVGGIEISNGRKGGGIGFELGGRYGKDSGTDSGMQYTAESQEYYAGPRYEWRLGKWSPYVSAGMSLLSARTRESTSASVNDTDLGFYAGIGADYHFGSGWHLGANLRKTFDHNLQLAGADRDADAWQYLLRFGYAF